MIQNQGEIRLDTSALPLIEEMGFITAPMDFVHADRVVDFHVFIYVTKGELSVTEEGKDYRLGPGEAVFLKAGLHHYGKKKILAGTAWYYIHFRLDQKIPCREFVPSSRPAFHQDCREALCGTRIPKTILNLPGTPAERKLLELWGVCRESDPFRDFTMNYLLYGFLRECALLRFQDFLKELSLADRIALYLERHAGEGFSSRKLEREFFLSYKYLASVFKKEKGMSAGEYHTRLRIQRACGMLRATSLRISEISEAVGYPDPLYFSRVFRQIMGMGPREWRRKIPFQDETGLRKRNE